MNETRAFSAYEVANTYELQDGDILALHGGIFLISERCEWPGCVAFSTVLLGPLYSDAPCSIPKAWIKDWKVQGNELATWTRITDRRPQSLVGLDEHGVGLWKTPS